MKIFIGWLKRIRNIQRFNVWAGNLGDRIEPFFIDSNLTAEKYENMLR